MRRTTLAALLLWGLFCHHSGFAAEPGKRSSDKRNIETLLQRLSSADPLEQERGLSSLFVVNEGALPALPALIDIFKRSTSANRIQALGIMAVFGPHVKAAAPAVQKQLPDPDWLVRVAAAKALLRLLPESKPAIAVLCEALRSPERDVRLAAIDAIRDLGRAANETGPFLLEASADADPAVRARLADALGRIGPIAGNLSQARLRVLLSDVSRAVQVRAARSLWTLDEPADTLLPTLIDTLKLFRPNPKRDVAEELLNTEIEAVVAARLLQEIGAEAQGAVPALIAASQAGHAGLQFAAIEALGEVGPGASPALDHLRGLLLRDETFVVPFSPRTWSLGEAAATTLRRMGPVATGALLDALNSKEPKVRLHGVQALGLMPLSDPGTIPALLERCTDVDLTVRAQAALALGRLGKAALGAAPMLASKLNDEGESISFPGEGLGTLRSVGQHALAALRMIAPEPQAIMPSLSDGLKRDRRIGSAMFELLYELGPQAKDVVPAIEPLLDNPHHRIAAAAVLASIGPDRDGLLEILHKGLLDDANAVNVLPVRGLGALGPRAKSAVADLESRFDKDQHDTDQALLAAAIVSIAPPSDRAVKELATVLAFHADDGFVSEYHLATRAWKQLGDRAHPAIELLTNQMLFIASSQKRDWYRLQMRQADIRLNSARLLVDVSVESPEVMLTLKESCRSMAAHIRGEAATILGSIDASASSTAPLLAELLSDEATYLIGADSYGRGGTMFRVGERAQAALVALGVASIPALRSALHNVHPAARQRAALALGLIGPAAERTSGNLVRLLADPDRTVRAAAAESLGNLGPRDEQTVAALVPLLSDKHLAVRCAAASALGKIGPAARQVVAELTKMKADPFESARFAAARALQKVGGP